MVDIKSKIEEIASKIKKDDGLQKEFKSSPVAAVEKLLGVDLPDEQVKKIVEGIKAKIGLDDLGDKLGGLLGKKQ